MGIWFRLMVLHCSKLLPVLSLCASHASSTWSLYFQVKSHKRLVWVPQTGWLRREQCYALHQFEQACLVFVHETHRCYDEVLQQVTLVISWLILQTLRTCKSHNCMSFLKCDYYWFVSSVDGNSFLCLTLISASCSCKFNLDNLQTQIVMRLRRFLAQCLIHIQHSDSQKSL